MILKVKTTICIIILLIVVIIFFILFLQIYHKKSSYSIEECIAVPIYINNVQITTSKAYVSTNNNYAIVPVISIIEACGYEIDWLDEQTAVFTINNNKYTISLKNTSVVSQTNNQNLLIPAPGSTNNYIAANNFDIWVDNITFLSLMSLIDKNIQFSIAIDLQKNIINVTID